jgi:hypothetical protein
MKLPVINIIVVCCCAALFVACKKGEDESVTAQKLKRGKWKISACTATWKNGGADTTIDYYSTWRTCEQDDLIQFYDNGDGATDENTNKCPEDNQSDPFKWDLQDNDTKLHTVIGGTNSTLADILELSDTQLKLRYVKTDAKLGSVTYVETNTNIK